MPKVAAITSASQREQAYKGLRRLLVLQQVEPGQRLREPEWAQRLKVHRSALREAFARLEAEGLIDRGSQTGYFVPRATDADFIEVTKLRLALECLAIDEVCAQKTAPLQPMVEAADELERFVIGNYPLGVLEADRRFHESLIDAAGMRRLSILYHRAPLPLIHGDIESRDTWQQACTRTLAEHRQILDALQKRDADDAKRILRLHLTHRSMLPMCH
ncbi:MAG: GntR family transcriptional regulator [Tepidisphaeraceae bacterium]